MLGHFTVVLQLLVSVAQSGRNALHVGTSFGLSVVLSLWLCALAAVSSRCACTERKKIKKQRAEDWALRPTPQFRRV